MFYPFPVFSSVGIDGIEPGFIQVDSKDIITKLVQSLRDINRGNITVRYTPEYSVERGCEHCGRLSPFLVLNGI